MKISDLVIRYPTLQKMDGICRLRTFVSNDHKIVALITSVDDKNTSSSITNNIESICKYLIKKGFVPPQSTFIEHYESHAYFDETFDFITVNKNGSAEWVPAEKIEIIKLLNCEALELESSTFEHDRLVSEIEQLRLAINPRIDFLPDQDTEVIQRSFEIEKNKIKKESIWKLVDSRSNEITLQKQVKKDLSILAEVYAHPEGEYICFSEFPIGDGIVDFVVFTGRSRMDVILIEVKGADFFLTNVGDYNKISSKVEIALDQIRNRLRYIYENYDAFRQKVHEIREKVESGQGLYNSFRGCFKFLEVDSKKDIRVQSIVIAGRTREDYEESKKRHDYEFNSIRIMIESWDTWLRKLRRE
jgi:hypothetical protein